MPDDLSAVPEAELRPGVSVAALEEGAPELMLYQIIDRLLERAKSLSMAKAGMARVLCALGSPGNKEELLQKNPSPDQLQAAWALQLCHQQAAVRERLRSGKLDSLAAGIVTGATACNRGLVVTRGRVSEQDWKRLVGTDRMPILLADSPLAWLVVLHVHPLDHRRDRGAVLAMTRRLVWIVDSRRLVKTTVQACMVCRLCRREVQGQVMVDLPGETVQQLRPFKHLHLDLMGAFHVKGIGPQSHKTFKVWAAIFVCSVVKDVSVYSTDSILMALASHGSINGAPRMKVTDRGSQIVAAAGSQPN